MLYQAYQAHTDFYWPFHTLTSARVLLERLAPPAHLGAPLPAPWLRSGGWPQLTKWRPISS